MKRRALKYDLVKERARARSSLESRIGRDIGDIPPVSDSSRKAEAVASLQRFCKAYFPLKFSLPWSKDHLKIISKIEIAVLRGGLFAMAMPRGSGKTTLCEAACLWALLIGAHQFVFLVGSGENHALSMLEDLKADLMNNDLLLADFPDVIYPIRKLENQSRRCDGQLHHGRPTMIGWTADEIVLPSIPGSRAGGAIVRVTGITGNIRGAIHTKPNGESVRPSLVITDDPQTDQSARSLSQCVQREAIISGAVLGLAGPGKKISGIMPCTVIRPGDMADSILDTKKHPDWNGERMKMVYKFPADTKAWEKYAEIRGESLRMHGDLRLATDFYRANREAMDAGAEIAWPERFNRDELSAIQHAMNLKLQGEEAFFAEYQNEPLPEKGIEDEGILTADQIAQKVNGHPRGVAPIGVDHLTAFVDVQGRALFWIVCGWEDSFTGYVLDYGTYPDQKRQYFTLRDLQRTLQMASKNAGLEGSIFAGLEALAAQLLGREWAREDGAKMRVGLCLVDANWGTSTDLVYQFCRQSNHSAVLLPSHGRYVGAGSKPFSEYKRFPGDRVGLNWRLPGVHGKRAIRHILFDVNFWKSFAHSRLSTAAGDKGCLSLFGRDPGAHRLLAEHLTAEYRVKTEGRGRVVDEWKLRPNQQDNHWLDGLVGCAAAASMLGAALAGTGQTGGSFRSNRVGKIKLSALQGRRSA